MPIAVPSPKQALPCLLRAGPTPRGVPGSQLGAGEGPQSRDADMEDQGRRPSLESLPHPTLRPGGGCPALPAWRGSWQTTFAFPSGCHNRGTCGGEEGRGQESEKEMPILPPRRGAAGAGPFLQRPLFWGTSSLRR